jgi:hypothetical protein
MMQHQFLLNNMDECDQLQDELGEIGINEHDIHFVTEVSSDYAGHHVHEASILEETDMLHSSLRGAFWGLGVGVIVNAFVLFTQPFGWQMDMVNIVFMLLLCVGFGGWMGGLVGIMHRNYRLSKYESDLRNGKAIMLVYTDDEHAKQAQTTIQKAHPKTKYLGKDSTFDNPLRNEKLAEMGH